MAVGCLKCSYIAFINSGLESDIMKIISVYLNVLSVTDWINCVQVFVQMWQFLLSTPDLTYAFTKWPLDAVSDMGLISLHCVYAEQFLLYHWETKKRKSHRQIENCVMNNSSCNFNLQWYTHNLHVSWWRVNWHFIMETDTTSFPTVVQGFQEYPYVNCIMVERNVFQETLLMPFTSCQCFPLPKSEFHNKFSFEMVWNKEIIRSF